MGQHVLEWNWLPARVRVFTQEWMWPGRTAHMYRDKDLTALINHILSGKNSDVKGKLALHPRDNSALVDTVRRFFPPGLLSWSTPERANFNTLYRSECALWSAPRLSSAQCPSAFEFCCWLLTDFIKIGGERQWSCVNLIYSISVHSTRSTRRTYALTLWQYRRKKLKLDTNGWLEVNRRICHRSKRLT